MGAELGRGPKGEEQKRPSRGDEEVDHQLRRREASGLRGKETDLGRKRPKDKDGVFNMFFNLFN